MPGDRDAVGDGAGPPNAGDRIAGKYEVERVLGAGGMGVVVAARHLQLGQRVAIKFMHPAGARDADAVRRFVREARAAVALTSEHVARVLDVGTLETGAPYMVMEYLAGEDLAHMIRQYGPMDVPLAVSLVLQACDAVAEAHALGVVHRDLKPANLFVTTRRDRSPLVKVLDFGISKGTQLGVGGEAQSLTASGALMGSPAYMSPEQIRSTKDVDSRSDIWSLGVILYELLTGVSPFVGETIGDTFAKITSETPVPIRQRRPDVPRGLSKVVERCLERKREDRVGSVSDLVDQLREFAGPDAGRGAGHVAGPKKHETLVAPSSLEFPPGVSAGANGPTDSRTEPPWLRSASKQRPPRSPDRAIAAVVGVAATVALVAIGGVWTHHAFSVRHAAEAAPSAAGAPAAESAAAAAPPAAAFASVVAPPEVSPPAPDAGVAHAGAAESASRRPAAPVEPPMHAQRAVQPAFKSAAPQAPPAPSASARHEVDVF